MLRHLTRWLFGFAVCFASTAYAEERVFSGPQVGEKLTPFEVQGVYDDDAGKKRPWRAAAGAGQPTLLIFVHEITRPSVAVTRILADYAAQRNPDGLKASVVFLADDITEMTNRLQRARHALPEGVPISIATDGQEGPGAYGLNRNVALTILVADKGVVTANFALVQPSVQSDVPKIFSAIVKLIGGEAPEVTSEYGRMRRPERAKAGGRAADERDGAEPESKKQESP